MGIFDKRITNTPKEKVMNTSFEEIIRDYLNNEAKNDPAFAEKWDKRKAEDDKVIEGCCAYITSEARKKAKNGCAVIADAEVFGWAFHYIQEDIKAPEKKQSAKVSFTPPKGNIGRTAAIEPIEMVKKDKPTAEPAKPKKAKVEWPSLFNFDE